MPVIGNCKLCLADGVELLVSHFVSRKLYRSGKKRLEFINLIESGFDPAELKAPLLCRDCEARFSINGEHEVLKHVAPKRVLKSLPLSDLMRVGLARDNDSSAPRFNAHDFKVNTEKFAYFALSIVWRRTIHEWSPAFPRWELGQFAEDMRRYLLGQTPFPADMAVIVIVCNDTTSRRTWTVPNQFVEAGCFNFAFDVRGIRFRVMMGHLPPWTYDANCLAPHQPIFWADCEKKTQQAWENTKLAQIASKERGK